MWTVNQNLNDKTLKSKTSNNDSESIKWKICNALIYQKVYLKKHVAIVHEGKKPFKCSKCETSFSSNAEIKRYIASVHDAKKLLKYNDYEASFLQKDHLKTHMSSVHRDKKSFDYKIGKCSLFSDKECEKTH